MRLHHIMQALKPHASRDALVGDLFAAYPQMHHFEFGSIDPVSDEEWIGLQLYAFDLLEHDLFDVPYDVFSFGWSQTIKGKTVSRIVACDKIFDRNEGGQLIFGGLRCWMFSSAEYDGKKAYHCMHTLFSAPFSKESGKVSVLEPEIMPARDDGTRVKAEADECQLGPSLVCDLTALVALLHAEGVTTQTTPAPTRLNKIRAAKGKLAIGAVSHVYINVGKRQHTPSGNHVGSHASPRMHWRRGHIRRLPDGKITNVRPCLVGNIGSSAPRDYKVKVA